MKKHVGTEITFGSKLERSRNRLWGCHFTVPVKVARKLMEDASRRVVCTLNGGAPYQCAMLPHGKGKFVITVNKTLRTKLNLNFGDAIQVTVKPDSSRYGLPVPEELEALLRQDAEAKKLFHALTKGRQRTLLYIIGQVKNSDKRLRRAVTVLHHLKANKGIINYKLLSLSLRDQRRHF